VILLPGSSSKHLQLICLRLAGSVILDDLVAHLLAFVQFEQAGTMHGADVYKDITPAVVRMNKSVALVRVEIRLPYPSPSSLCCRYLFDINPAALSQRASGPRASARATRADEAAVETGASSTGSKFVPVANNSSACSRVMVAPSRGARERLEAATNGTRA
jgi:hypothetical protein